HTAGAGGGGTYRAGVANGESIANRDVVLWYYGGLHHLIREEDSGMTHLCGSASCLSPSTCGRTPRSTREPGGTPRAEGRKEVAMSQRKVTRHRFLKRSGARLLRHWLVLFAAAFLIIGLTACSNFSYNLAVESVNQYSSGFGPGSDLSNSIANGDGFILGMTQPAGSPWVLDQR